MDVINNAGGRYGMSVGRAQPGALAIRRTWIWRGG